MRPGTIKKGHVSIQGLPITIENPKGSTRKGTDESGQKWETKIKHHYGYVKRTEGKDGDQVDVFIGPNPESEKAFVIDQVNPRTKVFDEHKVMLGFETEEEARAGYLANYDKSGESRIGTITETNTDEFKTWLNDGNTKKPFAKKDKVTTLITKPMRAAYKKLHDDIGTRVEETLAKAEKYKGWKFEVNDRVKSKSTGNVLKITGRTWDNKTIGYVYV